MKSRQIGYLIIGGGFVIGYIFYFFHKSLREIITLICEEERECGMLYNMINPNLIYFFIILIIGYGFYIVFFGKDGHFRIEKKKEKRNNKTNTAQKDYSVIMAGLGDDERDILQKIIDEEGSIYQSELVRWSGFSKVKITRILDKLEGKNLIERKRRGMTNIVTLIG